MFLIRDLIFQDHVIKGSRDFKVESPSSYIKTLPSLMAIDHMVVEIYFNLTRDLERSRDQKIIELDGWDPSR